MSEPFFAQGQGAATVPNFIGGEQNAALFATTAFFLNKYSWYWVCQYYQLIGDGSRQVLASQSGAFTAALARDLVKGRVIRLKKILLVTSTMSGSSPQRSAPRGHYPALICRKS